MPVISISNAQRRPVPNADWVRTIHHGLPDTILMPQPVKPSYFAFLGRIAPEKRVDRAIHIARGTGVPLKIAAKVDKADHDYFEENIRPLMDGTGQSNTSVRSPTGRRRRFSAAPRRCWFRSTGRSRSAW